MDKNELHDLLWTRIQGGGNGHVSRAIVDLGNFADPAAKTEVEEALRLVVDALGAIFPLGNDILLEEATRPLESAYAKTTFHGLASTMVLDFDSHRLGRDLPLSHSSKGYLAQTLTHEFVLHNLREFSFYRASGRQPEEFNAHRDACLPGFREIYAALTLKVATSLPPEQRRTFVGEWEREIIEMAKARENHLSPLEAQEAEQWVTAQCAAMLESLGPLPASSDEGSAEEEP